MMVTHYQRVDQRPPSIVGEVETDFAKNSETSVEIMVIQTTERSSFLLVAVPNDFRDPTGGARFRPMLSSRHSICEC
jgi:hypothetical protein